MSCRLARRARAALSGALLFALAHVTSRARGAEPVAWTSPERARIVRWVEPPAVPREVDPRLPIDLDPEDLLVLPVGPGDRVRLRGPKTAVGLGSGPPDQPDVVTWLPESSTDVDPGTRRVDVPVWSGAHTLVVRLAAPCDPVVSSKARIRVEMAATTTDPLLWHRLDRDVYDWLHGRTVKFSPPLEAEPALRWVEAARNALEGAHPSEYAPWLMRRWLEESYRERPIIAPYFFARSLTFDAPSEAPGPTNDDEGNDWWAVERGQHLSIRGDRLDVVRLGLKAKASSAASISVRVGGALARAVTWQIPSRAFDPSSFTAPEWIRVVVPAKNPEMNIEVIEGSVAIAAIGYRHKTDILDAFRGARDRARLESARAPETHVAALERADVAPLVRVLGYAEASRAAVDTEEVLHLTRAAVDAAERLPLESTLPLIRRALEHAVETSLRARKLSGDGPAWLRGPTPALPDEVPTVRALWATLFVPYDGARPFGAALAEHESAMHPELERAGARARQAWLREGPWRELAAAFPTPTVATIVEPIDDPLSPNCHLVGPGGQRWTLLADPATEVDVANVGGTHARVLLRAAAYEPVLESIVAIDGVPVSVHGGAGLVSVVGLEPGRHVITRDPDAPPSMTLLPRDGDAPCRSLREIERWASVDRLLDLELPAPGRPTVARVIVRPLGPGSTELPAAPRRPRALSVRAGPSAFEAWVRGRASGEVEVPVPRDSTSLHVDVSEPMLLRASLRLHPAAEPPAQSVAARGSDRTSVEDLLERVRAASRKLAGTSSTESVRAIRRERAAALDGLGYVRFADLDRSTTTDVDANEPAEGSDDMRVEDGKVRVLSLTLPAASPSVAVLGYVGKVPPLRLPHDRSPLVAARRRWEVGDAEGTIHALTSTTRDGGEDAMADRLLLALAAERAGHVELARDAIRAIGTATRTGAAIAHASTLTADLAVDQKSLELTADAYVMAQSAVDQGDQASGAFARLSRTMRWVIPSRAVGVAGSALVEVRGIPPTAPHAADGSTEPNLTVRVRRALLDAAPDALLLSEGEQLMVRLRRPQGSRVTIDQRCYSVDGGSEDCQVPYALDGVRAVCPAQGTPVGGRSPSAAWQTTSCAIAIPAGEHRLVSVPDEGRQVIASISLREEADRRIDVRVVSSWIEVDEERPIELPFAGPTVVRLRARSDAHEPRTLSVAIDRAASVPWTLDRTLDPMAGRWPASVTHPLSVEVERRIAVAARGAHTLRVAANGGRALVRLDMTTAVSLPTAREIPNAEPPLPNELRSTDAARESTVAIPEDPDPGPATVEAKLLVVHADIIQADAVTLTQATTHTVRPYAELQASILREIVANRAWASAEGIGRWRVGQGSYGGQGNFDSTPLGLVPGFLAAGKAIGQPFESSQSRSRPATQGTALGLHGRVQAYWAVPLTADAVLVPWIQHNSTRVDDRVKVLSEADGDVYTLYDASHPHYESAGARLQWRPFVDTQVKVGGTIRSTPPVDGVDRYEARVDGDCLPGAGLSPWVGVSFTFSQRPVTPDRPVAFFRTSINPRVSFFHWLSRGQRVTAGVEANVVLDRPEISPGPPLLSGWVFLSYDYSGGRGVRDMPPRDTMFRDRMEEGSGRIVRGKTGTTPAWGEGQ